MRLRYTALMLAGWTTALSGQDGAFLSAYQPRAEHAQLFEEGYRRHLDWHRTHGDSLSWIGWTIVLGDRVGGFVDGAFGISFRALDERVDPRGDRADAAATFLPHATATFRRIARLRADLGHLFPAPEDFPPLVQVRWLSFNRSERREFDRVWATLQADTSIRAYCVFELVDQADRAMVMTWLDGWGDLDDAARDPWRKFLALGAVPSLRIDEIEVWAYRPDLSYWSRSPDD